MRYAIRSYIFTASSSPSLIASTRTALGILRNSTELRQRLWNNADTLYKGLKSLGFTLGPEVSPVVAVILDEEKQVALSFWNALLEHGVYVNIVLPPATPTGRCLLRCSLSAAHTGEQIDAIIEAFASVVET